MKLAMLRTDRGELPALQTPEGWLPLRAIGSLWPGAAPLAHGDVLEARIEGFPRLVNPVVDLKCAGEKRGQGPPLFAAVPG